MTGARHQVGCANIHILYSAAQRNAEGKQKMARPTRRDAVAVKRGATSLSSQIHTDLLARIQNGEIGPEDRLVDIGIAQEMGVSRMPVREALLRLANDGYVTSTTRGFMLSRLEHEDITDIFEVRRLIEPRAAANAARDLTAADHAVLTAALEDARAAIAARDITRLAQANVVFRHTWLGAVRNTRLAETISRFADQVQFIRGVTLDDPHVQQIVLVGLTRLHAAFLARDAMATADAMTDFLVNAQQAYDEGYRRGSAGN